MLGIAKVECLFCGERIRRRDARATKGAVKAFVCNICYAKWDRAGRRCVVCETPVRGMQHVGMFLGGKALGHADCGAVSVLRACANLATKGD